MQSVTDSVSVTYDAVPASVARARTAVTEFADGVGATLSQVDAIRLATSEAVTNAVVHAYREKPGQVYVTAVLAGPELWLLVADDGQGLQPQAQRPGLGLISQVCDEMAIVTRSTGGTEVRIRFDLEPTEIVHDGGAVAPGQISVPTPAPQVAAIRAAPPTD